MFLSFELTFIHTETHSFSLSATIQSQGHPYITRLNGDCMKMIQSLLTHCWEVQVLHLAQSFSYCSLTRAPHGEQQR